MNRRNDITGAILAGGRSTRMGRDKALLDLHGKSFIQRVGEILEAYFEEVIIISDRGEPYRSLGFPIYEDVIKNCGPLGGIHSALTHARTDSIFILSCDLPFLPPEVIESILQSRPHYSIVVPASGGDIQPLCGYYHRSILQNLRDHLDRGQFKVHEFLEEEQAFIIPIGQSSFFDAGPPLPNINTPKDYEDLIVRTRSRHL